MSFERLRQIADAVLYEGYVLYPYRSTSRKNRMRWQFGVLAPPPWADASRGDASWMELQCLLDAQEPVAIEVRLRFLHVRRRRVEALRGGAHHAVDSLEANGELHVPWDEGEVREIDVSTVVGGAVDAARVVPFEIARSTEVEPLGEREGVPVGRFVRDQEGLAGRLRIETERVTGVPRLVRVRIRVDNETSCAPDLTREDALAHSLIGSHLMLACSGGEFVSLLDPPDWARAAAAQCENVRTYPVLGGAPGQRDLVLSSPIILYDHPQIAPESPGDSFDATEIDEILTLRTMLLTDDEKREVRATDPRAAAIVDRADSLPPEIWERLHGAVRSFDFQSLDVALDVPTFGVDDELQLTSLELPSGTVTPGARVLLHPGGARRTDAQDMFLEGRTAKVEKLLRDVDDQDFLAVTIDDDPAADLHRQKGRFHFFYPDEVELVAAPDSEKP
jgi:hypothetical protein